VIDCILVMAETALWRWTSISTWVRRTSGGLHQIQHLPYNWS